MPSAMAASSGHAADLPGVGRPSAAKCLTVRAVEMPKAPASSAAQTTARISSSSGSVGRSKWSPPRSPMT